jgi:hypothetical protein
LPHLAVRAADQDVVPGLNAARLAQALEGRDEGHADRARFFKAEILGLGPNSSLRQDHPFRVAAILGDAQFASAAPDFSADQVCGAFTDNASEVTARRPGPDRMRHVAERSLHVRRVDTGRNDFHEDLTRSGSRDHRLLDDNLEIVEICRLFLDPQRRSGFWFVLDVH